MISWPQVLGHEVVGVVDEVGRGVTQRRMGERVVLNPWLSCVTRGLAALRFVREGDLAQCLNFGAATSRRVFTTATARPPRVGLRRACPATNRSGFPIPDEISDEAAVLGDPFSVSLHAILAAAAARGHSARVWLRHARPARDRDPALLHPARARSAVARFDHQARLAEKFGAERVFSHRPARAILEAVAET